MDFSPEFLGASALLREVSCFCGVFIPDSSEKSQWNHKEHKEIQEKHPRLSVFISGWKTFLQ